VWVDVSVSRTSESAVVIARLRPAFRLLLAALVAVALSVGATACGDSDDDAGDSAADTSAQTQQESGGGGESKEGGVAGPGPQPGSSGPALSGDTAQARQGVASVEDVYGGFVAAAEAGVASAKVPARDTLEAAGSNKSLTTVCDLMSGKAQQQTITYAKRSAGLADVKWTCESATGLLLRRAGQAKGGLKRSLQAEVVGVNAQGDRATATVRFGKNGATTSIPLVKEDGKWKLAASPSGGGK
jgi:hypothetical protein